MSFARAVSWFRASSVIFAWWGVTFFLFPGFTNRFMGVGYVGSGHAEDWTRLVGLFCLAFAFLLDDTHRKGSREVRRTVARGVLALTVPSVLLMGYWQITPQGRWHRLDIITIGLLCAVSYGMFLHSGIGSKRKT